MTSPSEKDEPEQTPPGRIPDLEATRINAAYWKRCAWEAKGAEAVLFMEQAHNAWLNAAYAMADQRDALQSATTASDGPKDGPLSYPRLLKHTKALGETLAKEREALAFFMLVTFNDGYFDDDWQEKERVRAWLLDPTNRIHEDITIQDVVEIVVGVSSSGAKEQP